MKKIFWTLFIFSATINISVAQTAGHAVKKTVPNLPADSNVNMSFKETVINYGKIAHYSNGTKYFKFTNKGSKPLRITNCEGSCGCTVPTWPKKPIKPGESGVITVKYATDRVGKFEKSVTVHSNSKTPTTVLKITGEVSELPKTLPAGQKAFDATK